VTESGPRSPVCGGRWSAWPTSLTSHGRVESARPARVRRGEGGTGRGWSGTRTSTPWHQSTRGNRSTTPGAHRRCNRAGRADQPGVVDAWRRPWPRRRRQPTWDRWLGLARKRTRRWPRQWLVCRSSGRLVWWWWVQW
jgi:hypothetical protein